MVEVCDIPSEQLIKFEEGSILVTGSSGFIGDSFGGSSSKSGRASRGC